MTAPLTLVGDGDGGFETMTLAAACDALGVSASTLRRWVEAGRITALRTPGGHRRFRADEVNRLATQGGSAPVNPAAAPAVPLARVADLLTRAAVQVGQQAARAVYGDREGGWFTGAAATASIALWSEAVARSCRSGDYSGAATSTLELMRRARIAGTSLLERQMWLERCGDMLVRVALAHQLDKDEVRELRRLLVALRHRTLQLEERAVPSAGYNAA